MQTNPQFPADFVTFTEEILNEKYRFLCSVSPELNQLIRSIRISLFHATGLILYPLKTLNTHWFSVFRRIERDLWHEMG